jgi:aminopeptidase N
MFGGMENAGCIFYSENSVTGRQEAERLIAHEIAHQWFGNSVTEEDWHHVWLSEGFATYFTSCYMASVYGDEKLQTDMQSARSRIITSYRRSPAPVIDTTVTEFMKLLNTYSYQKGAWVLYMLSNEIGEKAFNDGIRIYYNRYRNRTATTPDLVEIMEEVSGNELDYFFNQWLSRPEIPAISIAWEFNSRRGEATITIEQLQPGYIFNFPLEAEIITDEGSELHQFRIDKQSQSFVVKTGSRVNSINPDPGVKLLYMNND